LEVALVVDAQLVAQFVGDVDLHLRRALLGRRRARRLIERLAEPRPLPSAPGARVPAGLREGRPELSTVGGAAFYRVEFRGFEGSSGRWGNGSSDDVADAEAEDVWRQLSVWQRYLNRGEFDSRSPATFEWGDYSSSGAYDPIAVSVEEPAATFSAEEQTSVFSGDVTLISVRAIEQARQSTAQDSR